MDLKRIFNKCLSNIGGDANKDVHWYREERPKHVSKENFFEQSVWAIWVRKRITDTWHQLAHAN
jgi:hypothetical protein